MLSILERLKGNNYVLISLLDCIESEFISHFIIKVVSLRLLYFTWPLICLIKQSHFFKMYGCCMPFHIGLSCADQALQAIQWNLVLMATSPFSLEVPILSCDNMIVWLMIDFISTLGHRLAADVT